MNKNSEFADERATPLATIERDGTTRIRVRLCERGDIEIQQFFRSEVGGAWKFGEGVRIRTTEAEVVIRALRQGLDIAQDIAERPEWEDKFNEWLAGRGQLPAGTIAGLRRLASIRARDAGREATGGANEL